MMIRTKTIATVGPACANKKTLEKMISLGVVCFRINLSHGSERDKATFRPAFLAISAALINAFLAAGLSHRYPSK